MRIVLRKIVQSPVVDPEPNAAVLLFNEDDVRRPFTLTWLNDSLLLHLSQKIF